MTLQIYNLNDNQQERLKYIGNIAANTQKIQDWALWVNCLKEICVELGINYNTAVYRGTWREIEGEPK